MHTPRRSRKLSFSGPLTVARTLVGDLQDWIQRVAARPVDGQDGVPHVCVIELGGTVGDIESAPFVEALRQFVIRVGESNIFQIHVSLVPIIGGCSGWAWAGQRVCCLGPVGARAGRGGGWGLRVKCEETVVRPGARAGSKGKGGGERCGAGGGWRN